MKHLLHSGAAILLASFISGCATHVTMIGPAHPAISPAAVRIYETPPRHYEEIAIINSSAGTTWLFPDRGSLDEAIADLRTEPTASYYSKCTIGRLADFRWAWAGSAAAAIISTAAAGLLVGR